MRLSFEEKVAIDEFLVELSIYPSGGPYLLVHEHF
jgi:hypothetical protein